MAIILKKKNTEGVQSAALPTKSGTIIKKVPPLPTSKEASVATGGLILATAKMATAVMGMESAGLKTIQDSVVVPPAETITPRQEAALEAAGLGGLLAPEPEKKKIVIKKKSAYAQVSPGDHINVTNPHFTWVDAYKFGDTGVVETIHTAPESIHTTPVRDDLIVVRMDKPRGVNELVIMSRWEIEVIKEEVPA